MIYQRISFDLRPSKFTTISKPHQQLGRAQNRDEKVPKNILDSPDISNGGIHFGRVELSRCIENSPQRGSAEKLLESRHF